MKWMVHGKRLPGYYPRILCIVLTLLLAALSYYYQNIELPEKLRQQEIMLRETMDLSAMEHDTVLMLRKGASLEKGSAIDEVALARLEVVERPVQFLPDEYLRSTDQVLGGILARQVIGGEVLVPQSVKAQDNRQEGYYRLVSVPLRDDLLGSLVEGKDVDILAHRDDGTYEILVSKTPLMQVGLGEGGKTEILIPVDDYEQRLIEGVRETVTFSARIYLDPTQPAAPCIQGPGVEVEDAH
jgi:hypothetical protein